MPEEFVALLWHSCLQRNQSSEWLEDHFKRPIPEAYLRIHSSPNVLRSDVTPTDRLISNPARLSQKQDRRQKHWSSEKENRKVQEKDQCQINFRSQHEACRPLRRWINQKLGPSIRILTRSKNNHWQGVTRGRFQKPRNSNPICQVEWGHLKEQEC